jgi:hypothetical protein
MEDTRQDVLVALRSTPPVPPVLATMLMMAIWMLLGGAAGIKVIQSIWRFLAFDVGAVSIAVPIGGVVGSRGRRAPGLDQQAALAGAGHGGVRRRVCRWRCRTAAVGRHRENRRSSFRRPGRRNRLGSLVVSRAPQWAQRPYEAPRKGRCIGQCRRRK